MSDYSFDTLVSEYGRKVFNLAFRLTGSREDSEDIVQETFADVYRSLDSFRGDSQLYTWLYKIAYHNCMKLLKTRSGQSVLSLDDEELAAQYKLPDDKAHWFESPEQAALMADLLREIRSFCNYYLVYRLPDNQRVAYMLRTTFGLTYSEIAEITGASENVIKARLNRARETLAELIANKNKTCRWLNDGKTDCCKKKLGLVLSIDYELLDRMKVEALETGIISAEEAGPPAPELIDALFERFPELLYRTERLCDRIKTMP